LCLVETFPFAHAAELHLKFRAVHAISTGRITSIGYPVLQLVVCLKSWRKEKIFMSGPEPAALHVNFFTIICQLNIEITL